MTQPSLSLSQRDALLNAARAAQKMAYAPYSQFLVGAAVLDEQGRIHSGCNVENAAYPEGLCAEASALSAMVLAGSTHVRAVLVVGTGGAWITPCGGCRQKLREFCDAETPIFTANETDLGPSYTLAQLLPASFGPDHPEHTMNTALALGALARLAPTQRARIAVVLGSGWGGLTQHLQNAVQIPYSALPGFPQASVAGHSGMLWLGQLGEHDVAVMSGRQHGYETGEVDGMKTPLRVLQALGCEVLVQTNAAGSLRHDLPPQSLMVISDHINLPQRSPLVGEHGSERFVGMVEAYDPDLRQLAHHVAKDQGVALQEGVYVWAFGPQFETPAEIRYFRQMGGDAVGMSTVPETILARHAGLRVLALSLITNMGAGLSQEQLSHAHTLAQASSASATASAFLAALIARIDLSPAKA